MQCSLERIETIIVLLFYFRLLLSHHHPNSHYYPQSLLCARLCNKHSKVLQPYEVNIVFILIF